MAANDSCSLAAVKSAILFINRIEIAYDLYGPDGRHEFNSHLNRTINKQINRLILRQRPRETMAGKLY